GRQKLARFNAREFATLLIDILGEAKRRQQGKSLLSPTGEGWWATRGGLSISTSHAQHPPALPQTPSTTRCGARVTWTTSTTTTAMDSSDLSDGPITLQEYLEVKKALAASEAKVQQLMKVNNSLSDELRRLQREV
ncbi:GIT1 protein, partial [Pluvianellus socialis]|nr:GIT1 protein [Pluvianellus socialis]